MDKHHAELLKIIQINAGDETYPYSYIGTQHPLYNITNPVLRLIAKEWKRDHKQMSVAAFQKMITSLVHGKSATEKLLAGMLLDVATPEQRNFKPALFDDWLNHLEGWAEVDTLCTGQYTNAEIPRQWSAWQKLLTKWAKSKNIHKRRASLVFLCSPAHQQKDDQLATLALANIDQLKHEKEILITKAISWLLRSLVKHHKKLVNDYVSDNRLGLPAIAVRETMTKITTGKKNPKL
ncbi:MAG: DNA alkylation repair protein [Cyclobacteriaceae bacterium]|jgi:3-methyladenine DNA glycosylase AlkD|nr:DNA alkylation repair protein [Flammeovirgaceae bacterium]